MPQSMRDELFALPGPVQGPEPNASQYFSAPAGPDQQVSEARTRREIGRRIKAQHNRRRVGAGLGATLAAGLGIQGLSRMGREEEEQQY